MRIKSPRQQQCHREPPYSKTLQFAVTLKTVCNGPLSWKYFQPASSTVNNIFFQNTESEPRHELLLKAILSSQRPVRVNKNTKNPCGLLEYRSVFTFEPCQFSTFICGRFNSHLQLNNTSISRYSNLNSKFRS